jgi:hypothetical protein
MVDPLTEVVAGEDRISGLGYSYIGEIRKNINLCTSFWSTTTLSEYGGLHG